MWRGGWKTTVALIGIAIAERHLRLTIPGLTVRWSVKTMLFEDWTSELRSTSKPVESIFFPQVSLWDLLDLIDGAVLAARIGRSSPLVCSMAACP